MSDVAIRVEGLGKQYRIGGPQASYRTLRESLVGVVQSPIRRAGRLMRGEAATDHRETIWALKDVSFEVKHGEVLGIIGRNGAGKSTLLKILSRITAPTEGTVDLYGRVGSLLEVGTGFHPELTGRENIYLNGAILGMRRAEIDQKFDEIVAFAELEKFLDTPVKHYSSGMYVRLAFAVAAHLDPEILLVDEVLAVGDAAFQKKCLGKMGEVAGEGRTVLFVSHNMAAVRSLCSQALLISGGKKLVDGPTELSIAEYMTSSVPAQQPSDIGLPEGRLDSPGRGTYLRLFSDDGSPKSQFRLGEPWKIILEFEMTRSVPHVIAGVGLINQDSVGIITYWSKPKDLKPGCYGVEFECSVPLKACTLRFAVGLSSNERAFYYVQDIGCASVSEVAVDDQPFRASGAGILLSDRRAEIQSIRSCENYNGNAASGCDDQS